MTDAGTAERPAPPSPRVIDQIRALAGAPPDATSFTLRGASGEIRVLHGATFAGGIELRAPFPEAEARAEASSAYRHRDLPVVEVKRPLTIYLRKERESDRRYKAAGINKEVQTGDAAFDAEVYINALYDEDAHVRAVLAHEDARAAAVALLREDPFRFLLDDEDGSVQVHYVVYPGTENDQDPERGRRIVEAFDRLMGALPRLKTIGRDGRVVRGWMIMLAWAAALAPGAVLFFTTRPPECLPGKGDLLIGCGGGPECCEPVVAGLAAGGALAIAAGLVIWRFVRGRSNSSTKQKVWMILTTGLALEAGVVLARLLW